MNVAPTVKIIFVKLLLVKVAGILGLTELWVCVSLAAELHRNLGASCFPRSVPNVLISPRAYLLKNRITKIFQAKWRSFDWVQQRFLWEEMVLLKDALRRMFESYTGESSISDLLHTWMLLIQSPGGSKKVCSDKEYVGYIIRYIAI